MRWRRWRQRGRGFDDKNSTTALKSGSRVGIFIYLAASLEIGTFDSRDGGDEADAEDDKNGQPPGQ